MGYSQRTFDKNPFKMMLAYTENELLIVEWPIFCLLRRVVPSPNLWIIVLSTIQIFWLVCTSCILVIVCQIQDYNSSLLRFIIYSHFVLTHENCLSLISYILITSICFMITPLLKKKTKITKQYPKYSFFYYKLTKEQLLFIFV